MSLSLYDQITRLLSVLPIIIIVTLLNVLISFCTAGVVMMQLLTAGVDKYLSLGMALLIAIGCHAYIVFNHKLRNYIKTRSQQ